MNNQGMSLYTPKRGGCASVTLDLTRHENVAWTQTAHPVQVQQGPNPHAPILDSTAEPWLFRL